MSQRFTKSGQRRYKEGHWVKQGEPVWENIRVAVLAAFDDLSAPTVGGKPRPTPEYCTDLETHLRGLTPEKLGARRTGPETLLGTSVFQSLKAVQVGFAEVLVDAIRHHPSMEVRRYFKGLETYHLPARSRDVWLTRGKTDLAKVRRALQEACDVLGIKDGQNVHREQLEDAPLRYAGARLGRDFFSKKFGAEKKGWRAFLPTDVHSCRKEGMTLATRRQKIWNLLDVKWAEILKGAPLAAPYERLDPVLHSKPLVFVRQCLPSYRYSLADALVDALRRHPNSDIARHYERLRGYHIAGGTHWTGDKGVLLREEVDAAFAEAIAVRTATRLSLPGQRLTDWDLGEALAQADKPCPTADSLLQTPLFYGATLAGGFFQALREHNLTVHNLYDELLSRHHVPFLRHLREVSFGRAVLTRPDVSTLLDFWARHIAPTRAVVQYLGHRPELLAEFGVSREELLRPRL